jgi:hypothetical protein
MAALIFGGLFKPLLRRHGGATGVLFRAHSPRRGLPERRLNWGLLAVPVYLACRTLSLSTTVSLLHYLR